MADTISPFSFLCHHESQLAKLQDLTRGAQTMCRNIKTLFNFEPPATHDEIQAAAVQFVRKVCGTAKPSKANEATFDQAVSQITDSVQKLLDSLTTKAPAKNREEEAAKARARTAQRFGSAAS